MLLLTVVFLAVCYSANDKKVSQSVPYSSKTAYKIRIVPVGVDKELPKRSALFLIRIAVGFCVLLSFISALKIVLTV